MGWLNLITNIYLNIEAMAWPLTCDWAFDRLKVSNTRVDVQILFSHYISMSAVLFRLALLDPNCDY